MNTEMTAENMEETIGTAAGSAELETGAADSAVQGGTGQEHAEVKEGKPAQKSGKSSKKSSSLGKLFGGSKKSSKGKADSIHNSEEDIRKLTRTELLELLIDETKEADRLRAENERLLEELEKCHEDLDRIASFEAVIARLESIVNGR